MPCVCIYYFQVGISLSNECYIMRLESPSKQSAMFRATVQSQGGANLSHSSRCRALQKNEGSRVSHASTSPDIKPRVSLVPWATPFFNDTSCLGNTLLPLAFFAISMSIGHRNADACLTASTCITPERSSTLVNTRSSRPRCCFPRRKHRSLRNISKTWACWHVFKIGKKKNTRVRVCVFLTYMVFFFY